MTSKTEGRKETNLIIGHFYIEDTSMFVFLFALHKDGQEINYTSGQT